MKRETFATSRLSEFASQKELTVQTGHAVEQWPLIIGKELIDNAIDSTEDIGVAPAIDVKVSTKSGEIIIADNGAGIPPETIAGVMDYTKRVSSREAYVSPTRGAQGNALKTLIAMPFALDGEFGETVIEAHGIAHRIVFEIDRVRRIPEISHRLTSSSVKTGTRLSIRWPESACSILAEAKQRFLRMASDFAWLNPHLSLSVSWNGKGRAGEATDPEWSKWLARDPTSAHWYDPDRFERYIAAHVAHAQDHGGGNPTVWEFISELNGLSGTAKRKAVLEEVGMARLPLAALIEDRDGIERLLSACQEHTRPVKPEQLGIIGKKHFQRFCAAGGADPETFKYKRFAGEHSNMPYVVETAFAVRPDTVAPRRFVTGVNWSVGIVNPFRELTHLHSLDGVLQDRFAGPGDPVVFVLHYACPRVDYTDRGKSAISLPYVIAKQAIAAIEAITKDWHRIRMAEIRDASRVVNRMARLAPKQRRVSVKDAASQTMEPAYAKASGNGSLPAGARQIMYAARPEIIALTGNLDLDNQKSFAQYFTQTLLPDFMAEHPELTASWDVVYDDRGTFSEPHTKREVGLGTVQVRDYARTKQDIGLAVRPQSLVRMFPTFGPENRYRTILFVEKEGFNPLLKAAQIAERFDVAIMSTKGMSVTAARLLLDRLSTRGVEQILVMHDFDVTGFSIFGTLGTDSRRYQFKNRIPIVDLGLRLADVQDMALESEPVFVKGEWEKRSATLTRHGATADEIKFLRDQRVELNAATSPQLVAFIEKKLGEHGVKKMVPDAAVIELHARRLIEQRLTEAALEKLAPKLNKQAAAAALPADLRQRVEGLLQSEPGVAWDDATLQIVEEGK